MTTRDFDTDALRHRQRQRLDETRRAVFDTAAQILPDGTVVRRGDPRFNESLNARFAKHLEAGFRETKE
jgi:hypothetical protein